MLRIQITRGPLMDPNIPDGANHSENKKPELWCVRNLGLLNEKVTPIIKLVDKKWQYEHFPGNFVLNQVMFSQTWGGIIYII